MKAILFILHVYTSFICGCLGLLEELSIQNTPENVRQERSRFVQELVVAAAEQLCEVVDDKSDIKSMLKLLESSPQEIILTEDEGTTEPVVAPRQPNVVLRGRARCDAQNARRRAEANRVSLEKNKDGSEHPAISR